MPPPCKFTKEEIIQASLNLVRESGVGAITARTLGARLGASSKPIFSIFENMEEVVTEKRIQSKHSNSPEPTTSLQKCRNTVYSFCKKRTQTVSMAVHDRTKQRKRPYRDFAAD